MQNLPEVEVTVQYYAKSRDISGRREESLSFPQEVTSRKVFDILIAKHSGLKDIEENCVLALNDEWFTEETGLIQLHSGDTIAVIPPLSGG